MWRLWLFLALVGLLIWGFARLQQRRNLPGDNGSELDDQVKPPSHGTNIDGPSKSRPSQAHDERRDDDEPAD